MTKRGTCKFSEEWDGSFIGRRHCPTHDVFWNDFGPCQATRPAPPTAPPATTEASGLDAWLPPVLAKWIAKRRGR